MDIQAIAVPRGAGLLWIRVGAVLDAAFGGLPDQIVERIVRVSTGFEVETRDSRTGAIKAYEAPDYLVMRVIPEPGEMFARLATYPSFRA